MVYSHNDKEFSVKKNEVLIHTTTWVNPQIIILSQSNQSQKATYSMILFIYNFENKQEHGDGRQISSCQGLGEGRMGSDSLMSRYPCGVIKVPWLDSADGCTILCIY